MRNTDMECQVVWFLEEDRFWAMWAGEEAIG